MPAIVDRDPVVVAIGTEGAAPILAREIKAKIEAWLPANFGRVAAAAPWRCGAACRTRSPIPWRAGALWEALLQGVGARPCSTATPSAAEREFERQLDAAPRRDAAPRAAWR